MRLKRNIIEELPINAPDLWQQVDALQSRDANELWLALFGPARDRLSLLKLRDPATASHMMPYFHSEMYKELEVSVVDHFILGELLGLSGVQDEIRLNYTYDRTEAINKVLDEEYQMTFILRPIQAGVIKAIADAGDKMPKKSTYFYPKIPSGLVFSRLV